MLWTLQSDTAEQYFKAWNTFVKLAYGVTRSTYTYLVEGYLAKDFVSLRNQILGGYPAFFQKLLNPPLCLIFPKFRRRCKDLMNLLQVNLASCLN